MKILTLLTLALAACGGSHDRKPVPAQPVNLMTASSWTIGPIIDGKNSSKGTPLHPTQVADGLAFDFPLAPGSVHYVTAPAPSLAGKTRIVMRYRIDSAPGVAFNPATGTEGMPSVGPTLYIQRRGDTWDRDGWRWWATFHAPMPIAPGTFEMDVPLDAAWTSVMTMTADNAPAAFRDAKANAGQVGFTFGGGTGYGHGVYATGPATFTLTEFRIE
jgi:hypothetical protein